MPYSHGVAEKNKFVLEGAYFDFEKIIPILKTYGINNLSDNFLLIGLVQTEKSIDNLLNDFKTYDTKNDWTYGFNDYDLKEIAEDVSSFSHHMRDYLPQYGFSIYDTSVNRERVFEQIVKDIKATAG